MIELRPDLAPKTVARMKELTRQHFFDGIVFHRVISGFMAQTGDPNGTGYGGSGKNLPAEFSSAQHVRGTVSMARAQDPNSADSQFFICFAAAPFLDGKYTIWGQVVSGMEFVDMIKKGDDDPNGMVTPPQDKIIKMQVRRGREGIATALRLFGVEVGGRRARRPCRFSATREIRSLQVGIALDQAAEVAGFQARSWTSVIAVTVAVRRPILQQGDLAEELAGCAAAPDGGWTSTSTSPDMMKNMAVAGSPRRTMA